MFDAISEQVMQILSLSLCGVSVATILANVIYCVKSIHRAAKKAKNDKDEFQKQLNVSKEYIENAFKSAVLPQKIKLDVSSKIENLLKKVWKRWKKIKKITLVKFTRKM